MLPLLLLHVDMHVVRQDFDDVVGQMLLVLLLMGKNPQNPGPALPQHTPPPPPPHTHTPFSRSNGTRVRVRLPAPRRADKQRFEQTRHRCTAHTSFGFGIASDTSLSRLSLWYSASNVDGSDE